MQIIYSIISDFKIIPLSDRSALLSFGNIIDESINEKVLLLHKSLQQSPFEGFIESVPAYASLAVFYHVQKVKVQARHTAFDFVKGYLENLLQQTIITGNHKAGTIKIPVCYADEYGFDILQLSKDLRLSVEQIINIHASVIYKVYMIGFMPGFAYMGTISERLIAARKAQPRLQVPAGSVGIAGAQTGIYPVDSPGGWQVIGRTPLRLFDSSNLSPCLLSAGDRIQFIPIDKNQFEKTYAH